MPPSDKFLDVRKIKTLIKSGLDCLPVDKYHKEAIILIGDTGVGKSTLISLFNRSRMIVKFDGFKVKLDTQQKSRAKIGHTKLSQTFMPTKILIDSLAFYDCPGFKDNKGEQFQLANCFYLQRLFDNYRRIKMVIVVDQSHISEVRAEKLPQLLRNLLYSFQSFDEICEGCCLIISKADQQSTKQDYEQQILSMINSSNGDSKLFGIQQCKFLKFLAQNNRVFLFKQPKRQRQDYVYEPSDEQKNILTSIKNLQTVKSRHIRKRVSKDSIIAVRQYLDLIINNSKNKIQILCSQVYNNFINESVLIQKQLDKMLDLKKKAQSLNQQLMNCEKNLEILHPISKFLHNLQVKDFQEDITAIQFFSDICNREQQYFKTLKQSLDQQTLRIVNKLETKISLILHQNRHRHQKQQKSIADSLEMVEKQQKEYINESRKIVQDQILNARFNLQQFQSQYQKRLQLTQLKKIQDLENFQHISEQIKKSMARKQEQLQQKMHNYTNYKQESIKLKQKSQIQLLKQKIQNIQLQQIAKSHVHAKNTQITSRIKQRSDMLLQKSRKSVLGHNLDQYNHYLSEYKKQSKLQPVFGEFHRAAQDLYIQKIEPALNQQQHVVSSCNDQKSNKEQEQEFNINTKTFSKNQQIKIRKINSLQFLSKQQKIQKAIKEIKQRRQKQQQQRSEKISSGGFLNSTQNIEKAIITQNSIYKKCQQITPKDIVNILSKNKQKAQRPDDSRQIKHYSYKMSNNISEQNDGKYKSRKQIQKIKQKLGIVQKIREHQKQEQLSTIISNTKQEVGRRRQIEKWDEQQKRHKKLSQLHNNLSLNKQRQHSNTINKAEKLYINSPSKRQAVNVVMKLPQINRENNMKSGAHTERHQKQKCNQLSMNINDMSQPSKNNGYMNDSHLSFLHTSTNTNTNIHRTSDLSSATLTQLSQLRSSSSLIQQISEVLKSLKVVSGDLEKVKSQAVTLSLKNQQTSKHTNHIQYGRSVF